MNISKNKSVVLGIALGLPSAIIGVTAIAYQLVKRAIIPEYFALILILLVVLNSFFIIIRYVYKKN